MQHRRIIKQGPVVLATREDGSMDPTLATTQGLFLADTRYLSTFQMCLNDLPPILLGSSEEILFEASYLLTNPDLSGVAARAIGFLWHNRVKEDAVQIQIHIADWADRGAQFELSLSVGSDFFDSFEARGVRRLRRGQVFPPKVDGARVELRYEGLDQVTRTTQITAKPPFKSFDGNTMRFAVDLSAGEQTSVELEIKMMEEAAEGVSLDPEPGFLSKPKPAWFDASSGLSTSNTLVDVILRRSIDDMEVLLTEYLGYTVPVAGLPRFAVPFGRDAIITALQTLVWNPAIARNVLYFLAKTQGKEENPWNYEQPGKIMHEMHTGELARLKEIPFGLFYGSVDSTPLFLVLGAEYIRWTGDTELYKDLERHFQAAWDWIDKYGDIDGSGYVQYKAHTPPKMRSAALTVGLFNQGWKDSANSVVYSNGEIVTDHPVTLPEVQGDLYRALSMWSEVYDVMPGDSSFPDRARKLSDRAARLKEQFNREFWMPEKNFYAAALDGHHRQVDSITSNPGECLWSRLIDDEHAEAVSERLLSDTMFTSWGIRTMANTEKAYNPFSYHNGSVWPFENALIASGFKKYGLVVQTQQVFDAMVDASLYFEYRRWPEVYCGVSKRVGGVLAQQPDACRPQAWSSGAIFFLLQTLLGIAPRAFSTRVDITPALPRSVDEIVADDISILGGTLGLRIVREGNAVLLEIKNNPNDLDIVVHPAAHNHTHMEGPDKPAVSR
jgi:glycogen debranching enzyme